MRGFSREERSLRVARTASVRRSTPASFPRRGSRPDPTAELARMKQEELGRLNDYGWVDRKAGVAHIPVERAIDILAKTGLPVPRAGASRRRDRRPRPSRPAATQETAKPASRRRSRSHDRREHDHFRHVRSASALIAGIGRDGPRHSETAERGEPGGLRPEAGRATAARPPLPGRIGPRACAWAISSGGGP